MNHSKSTSGSAWVRDVALAICFLLTGLLLVSFNRSHHMIDDVWKQLGLSQKQGTDKIKNSFIYGYLDSYGAKNFKSLTSGDRTSLAKDLLNYTKSYLSSPTMKTTYQSERESTKPSKPELSKLTKEDIRKNEIAKLEKTIIDTEKMIKQFPDMEKSARKSIDRFKNLITELQTPDNNLIQMLYDSEQKQNKLKEERYQSAVAEWEKNYPADHRLKIRAYLEKYLSTASTVDFDAALVEKYNKQYFVNATYEGKPDEWKMIFRAGKAVYQVAKPFAEQWLKELPVK